MANELKYEYSPEEAINLLYQNGLMADNQPGFLQILINDKLNIEENTFFWQEHFTVDGNEVPANLADPQKRPAYSVIQVTNQTTPMADPMAPLSETSQMDQQGFTEKTGSIYQYGKGMFQTSMGKIALQAKLASMGMDEQNIIGGFVASVAKIIKSHNSRLSYMAAQSLSTGGAYNTTTTQGMSGVVANQDAYIPASNFKNAGAKVWTDSACDIPTQIQKIVEDFKVANDLGDDFAMELDVPYDLLINTLLKNSYFVAEVNRYIRLYAPDKVIVIDKDSDSSSVNTSVVSMEQLVQYSRSPMSKIPPIRVIRQKSTVQDITTLSSVTGWSPNKVVLRPLGYAGVVVHATPSDIAMYQSGEVNSEISMSIAKEQGFLYVINKIVPNGLFQSYHTDIIGSYAPILNESTYHVIIDTATAG